MSDGRPPAGSAGPGIDELVVGDPPDAWRKAGFTVDTDDDVCRIGSVRVRLVGRDDGPRIRSWGLRGVPLGTDEGDVDGLVTHTDAAVTGPAEPAAHPNGARLIDHIVVATPDTGRTVAALEAIGLGVRRVRDTDPATYGAELRQTFFRLGEVILEVIGPAEPAGDGPAQFFGLALTVSDLDSLPGQYGSALGQVKAAVQPGRRIATLHHREVGLSVAIAFMDDGAGAIT